MTHAPGGPDEGVRTGTLEEPQVRAMFDRIARFYDVMNSVMTAGLHHQWRRRAADLAQIGPGSRVLDVATGTGDLALELSRRVAPGGEVVGSDFSEQMLERARAKAPALRFEWGNALELPYADGEFDAATVGFGARNFSDLDRGLAEMARVVRPGGKVVVLEITTPAKPPLSTFFRLWFDRVVPLLGRFDDAYTYLPNSVKRFPGPDALGATLAGAGLTDVRWILTAGGIIALHHGRVAAG
jgi:demethylmenaquinone methyltransferase/2-methoxy-6-polyprenyl-1,4-benzoquinol methylase